MTSDDKPTDTVLDAELRQALEKHKAERHGDRWRRGCAVIRAAMSNHDFEHWLRSQGFEPQAIADAFAIGQAEDVVAEAFSAPDDERRRRLAGSAR